MTKTITEKCATCKFFNRYSIAGNHHTCRRNPPQINGMGVLGGIQRTDWPIVEERDWCGEYVRELGASE